VEVTGYFVTFSSECDKKLIFLTMSQLVGGLEDSGWGRKQFGQENQDNSVSITTKLQT
jgi:hypothetical protein